MLFGISSYMLGSFGLPFAGANSKIPIKTGLCSACAFANQLFVIGLVVGFGGVREGGKIPIWMSLGRSLIIAGLEGVLLHEK